MKTYQITCDEALARSIRIEAQGPLINNPYVNEINTVVGYEIVADNASQEEALLQFITRPRNIQFVGKELHAVEITPYTVKMRQASYAERIKQAENQIAVARFLYLQL